jgi:hypothetical protein
MVERKRIGLREVRALEPGQTVWDASVPAFGARRQRSKAVAYVLFYRTTEGRQRWLTIGRHGAPVPSSNMSASTFIRICFGIWILLYDTPKRSRLI